MSEPRVLLLGGNKGSWSASERASDSPTMNGIEAWVYAFWGDYKQNISARPNQLEGYDIIIANSNLFAIKHLCSLAATRPKNSKWVTLIEGDASDFLKPMPFIRELLDRSDLVGCINKFTEGFFSRLTTTPVAYIGIPYPAETIRAFSKPLGERRREIFLSPMLLSRWSEYLCVKDIGVPLYGYENRVTRKLNTISKTLRSHGSLDPMYLHKKVRSLYGNSELTIYREEPLPDYFRRNSGAYLWLNLDPRYTWGRNVLDAAALQVPIVTTRSTGHAEDFFPLTTVANEFDVEEALRLVKRLLDDKDFYSEASTVSIKRFEPFLPEQKKKELLDILGRL